ncbi:MAG: hypothetical protein IJA81_11205 [Akkermansia sp.]|nr:hypothetical protein [Akkermansia sp.]
MTNYAQSYIVIGSVMMFILFCAFIYIVWHDDDETRRSGYCMLGVGAVLCVMGLWMLYVCEISPSDVFRVSRRHYLSRSNYDVTNLSILMGLWVCATFMGGKGLYKTLVRMGIWPDSDTEDDEV